MKQTNVKHKCSADKDSFSVEFFEHFIQNVAFLQVGIDSIEGLANLVSENCDPGTKNHTRLKERMLGMFASWSTSIINLLGTVGKVETFSGVGNAARTEVKSVGSKAKHTTDFILQATPEITQLRGGGKWSQQSRLGGLYSRQV